MRCGALDYRECVADDLGWGIATSFPRSVRLEEGEVVVLSWATYRSRAHRDEVVALASDDPWNALFEHGDMPFDTRRVFFGGFDELLAFPAAPREPARISWRAADERLASRASGRVSRWNGWSLPGLSSRSSCCGTASAGSSDGSTGSNPPSRGRARAGRRARDRPHHARRGRRPEVAVEPAPPPIPELPEFVPSWEPQAASEPAPAATRAEQQPGPHPAS